ncbi:hypothetical protein BKA70DRAFT_1251147 [Coprinopsis sp. MPI-PUGE-AT-0042]|nr:hypothetical protein BKA70DRAFT_1251147 [Coprinopsis sp. MPI-PUGE-AT-0042]
MFTVKATYRGEIRKISFTEHIWFPTYNDLCKQLYRVFPLNDGYHLSRLLFSQDSNWAGKVLIAMEVHNGADYEKATAQFIGRSYNNGLLRFTVFDDTPHKECSNSHLGGISSHSDVSMNDGPDKRPVVPPKPAGLFESTPFHYISSLSHTPSVSSSSRSVHAAMDDVARSLSQLEAPSSHSRRSCGRDRTSHAPGHFHREGLGRLFQEGSFPSMGPPRRSSTCTLRRSAMNSRDAPVIHTNVWCDICKNGIVGVRHKCLDCDDYDLCTACISQGGAERHDPFHEFFEIHEPGRVIVHTVGQRDGAAPQARAARAANQPPAPVPATHNAVCDLCESHVIGDRFKCLDCPDYDTCQACFAITGEQHPGHSFARLSTSDAFIVRDNCLSCMHPDCPDYDLCSKCEALPIAVHPVHHPLLKVKTPETLIPLVHRTIRSYQPTYVDTAPVAASSPEPEVRATTPQPVDVVDDCSAERPETPKPVASRDDDARSPFADPPMIDPIVGVHSLASSFEASINAHINARRIGLRSPSPVRSPLVEAPVNPFKFIVEKQDNAPAPSFVNDLMAQTQFTGLPTPMTQTHSPLPVIGALNALHIGGHPEEPTEEPEVALAELVSQNQSLISLAESVSDVSTAVKVEASTFHVPSPPPLAPFHATFVADVTVTDGQIFPPGAEFVKYWRMINDSSRDWPEATTCVYVGGTNLLIDPTSDSVKVGRVKAGEEVEVSTGELKAPEEPGRYVSYWRMRDEAGNLFGNSIWVEIIVAEPDHMSDDSLSASSIIMMPSAAASVTSRGPSAHPAESTVGGGTTATIPSVTEDSTSDIDNDSDVSLIDLVSSDEEEMGWEDARSHATVPPAATTGAAPATPATEDFVVLYDDSSDSDF